MGPLASIDWTPAGGVARIVVTIMLGVAIAALIARLTPALLRRLFQPGLRTLETASWDQGGRLSRRARTLEGFVVRTLTTVAVFTAFLFALGEAGVPIEPMIASAGIVGIAVAFGAQTIVQDALAGILILIEGPYNLGDFVRLNTVEGVVAEISLRSTTLITDDGAAHTVRNGAIIQTTNYTRDAWSHTLTLRVKRGVELEAVRRAVAEVAAQISGAPELEDDVISGPEVRGISALRGAGYEVEVRTLVRPVLRTRWPLLLNGLLAPALERNGVELE